MNSKEVLLEDFTKCKIGKKNLITSFFAESHFKDIFTKRWWEDLYYTFWDAKNRFFYGYTDRDWFDWNSSFATRNIELFQQFRDNNHSLMCKHPNPQKFEDMFESMTPDEQYEFFNQLIDALQVMQDDGNTVSERLFGKLGYECSREERQIVRDTRQKAINFFFDTIKERFDDLWD